MSSPYDWPRTHHWDDWALKVKLAAACVRGEAREGWVPCRVIRALIRVAR